MESLAEDSVSVGSAAAGYGSALGFALSCAVAVLRSNGFALGFATVVLRSKLQTRAGSGPGIGLLRRDAGRYAQRCKRRLCECAPEAASLAACLMLAAALRARGDVVQPLEAEAWAQIKAQWPLLMTADTLLSLQAMLRLAVLLPIVLRSGGRGCQAALSEESAALWLAANAARLLLLSRTSMYMLDGPLGGAVPVACEIAAVPILFVLGRGAFHRAAPTVVLIVAAAVCFAHRNHLALSEDAAGDALFVVAHSLDLLASLAHLVHSLLVERRAQAVSVGFTHLLMLVQQGLAAYYFWEAFSFAPELVGAGKPFEVLQIGSTVTFGAYFAASALFFAECYDASEIRRHRLLAQS